MIADSVAFCSPPAGPADGGGRRVLYDAEHYFDGYAADPEFALDTIRAAADAGAEIVVLCDTNGGSLPDFVAEAVAAASGGGVGCDVGIHCHNDSDLATANTLAAVRGRGGAGAGDGQRHRRAVRQRGPRSPPRRTCRSN